MLVLAAGLAVITSCHSPSSPSSGTSPDSPSGGSAALSITATWDVTADVDLHVIEPGLNEIYWSNPGPSATGGVLDGDADQECKTTSVGHKEVVHWNSSPPNGTYTVRLDYYDSCNAAVVNYTVTISDGKTTLPAITGPLTGSGDHGIGPSVLVKTFLHVGNSFTSLAAPADRFVTLFAFAAPPAAPRRALLPFAESPSSGTIR